MKGFLIVFNGSIHNSRCDPLHPYEEGDKKIHLKRKQDISNYPIENILKLPVLEPKTEKEKIENKEEIDKKDNLVYITSPMVGTFYKSSAPDAKPFVEMGDILEQGKVVCIIEAMKLMNEIKSEYKGKIVKVMVENGSYVEYGQSLFMIEPI